MADPCGYAANDLFEEETNAAFFGNVDSHFMKKYKVQFKEIISSGNVYILHSTARFHNSKTKLVVGLSNYQFIVYNIDNHLQRHFSGEAHKDVITGLKFGPNTEELFYTSSLDGSIKLWDSRTKASPSLTFVDDTDGKDKLKPISCFDVSCNGKFICGGTPLIEADSYLLFWDVRKASVLGGYWEAHTDDITHIRFSSAQTNAVMSGSLDGLINVFDIQMAKEENALQSTLNVGTSIRKVEWLDEIVSCVTDMETVQFWKLDNSKPLKNLSREELGKAMSRKSWDSCYITDTYLIDGEIAILGGRKREFKSMLFLKDKLLHWADFESNEQIVRCSCYDSVNDVFVTAGESGMIDIWRC